MWGGHSGSNHQMASMLSSRVHQQHLQIAQCRGGRSAPRPLLRPQQQQQQPLTARQLVLARSSAKKVTGEQLEVEIANRQSIIIIDFFATWCGPCLLMAQELDKVAAELGDKVTILKVCACRPVSVSGPVSVLVGLCVSACAYACVVSHPCPFPFLPLAYLLANPAPWTARLSHTTHT